MHEASILCNFQSNSMFFSDKETGTVSLICELMEMNIYEFIQGKSASI